MSWFKNASQSVSKVFNKVRDGSQKLFKKGEINGTKLFGKGSVGSKFLSNATKDLGQVANVTRQVGREVGEFAGKAAPVLATMGPFGESILAGATGLSLGLGGVSNTSRLASEATKQRNYNGSAGNVAANILEKAKGVKDAGSNISFV